MKIAHMTWVEYRRRIEAESPILILPCGSLEQHGPHLPLGADTLIPEALAERVAPLIGALIAPPLLYGCRSQPKSGGGNHFCGTTSLWGATFQTVLVDIVAEFARHGIRKIVLLDGHMENEAFLMEAADLAIREAARDGIRDLRIVKLAYWDCITKATEAMLFPDGLLSWALEHGAVMETSVLLHLHPDLVRRALIPDGPPAEFPPWDSFPTDPRPIPATGVLSSAAGASAEKGAAVVAQLVPDIAAAIARAFAD